MLNENSWVAELEGQDNLNAIALADTRKQWESSHSGLSSLGGVIVAALTAYYAGPMFNSLVSSSATSLSPLIQKSIATGLTASTTTAVVQFGTDGKIDGDLVFKAGLVAALGSALSNAKIWGENSNTSLNEMAGIDSTYTGTEARKAVMGLTFSQDQLLGIAGRGVINATLDSVINGSSFGDSILRGITNDFAALGAQSIGNAWGGNVLMNPSYNPDLQILAHMGLGGLAAGIRGDSIGSGALGGLLEGIIGNMVKEVNNQGLYTSGTMLASGLAAHLVGKDPVTAALAAQSAAENNRLLHESEKELANRLAQESGGKYTVKQMEDALRWAATSTEAMAVSPILLNSKTLASSIYDSGTLLLYNPRPGEADAMLYQDLTKIQQPSRELVAYIEGKTGNTYSWNPGLWQSGSETEYDSTRYVQMSADGKLFNLPAASCPAASCANTGGIAWASTNPEDQKILAAFSEALSKDVAKGVTVITVGGVALAAAPVTLTGTALTGGLSGGVLSGTFEWIDTGGITAGEVLTGVGTGTFLSILGYGVVAGGMKLLAPSRGTGAFLEGVEGGVGFGKLADRSVKVTDKGLNIVESHLEGFSSTENTLMLNRLRTAMAEGKAVTGADAAFYTHELAEATKMRAGLGYQAAHAESLIKYQVSPYSVYHPEVIQSVNQQVPGYFNKNWIDFWRMQ